MAVTGEELTSTISVPFCFLQRLDVVNIRNSKLVKLIYTFPQQETAAINANWHDKTFVATNIFCRDKTFVVTNICRVM